MKNKIIGIVLGLVGVLGGAKLAVSIFFPKEVSIEELLEQAPVSQVSLPDPIPISLKGEQSAILVVHLAIDYRALDVPAMEARIEDPHVTNRLSDVILKYYSGKTLGDIRSPTAFETEKRELSKLLAEPLFTEEIVGRVETTIFIQRTVQS